MYWYTKKNYTSILAAGIIISAAFTACQSSEQKNQTNHSETTKYFDIPKYIKHEIDSLEKLNPEIIKTATKDSVEETKTLKIKDWDSELASFKDVDLNKPAYAGYIKSDTIGEVIEYQFTNPKLDLSCVRISLDSLGNLKMISIQRDIKNTLYNTSEFLVYEKSKYYIVEKNQHVKTMGSNYYKIQGMFQ